MGKKQKRNRLKLTFETALTEQFGASSLESYTNPKR